MSMITTATENLGTRRCQIFSHSQKSYKEVIKLNFPPSVMLSVSKQDGSDDDVSTQVGISVLSYPLCGNPDVTLVKGHPICHLTCVNSTTGRVWLS